MRTLSVFIFLGCAALLTACAVSPNPGERRADSFWGQGDFSSALEITEPHAQLGEPWAQLRMGFYYDAGQGVPQDLGKAIDWYSKVAAQMAEGDWADGKFILEEDGPPRQTGHFGKRKDALIAKWRLATIYYEGAGVKRDLERALLLIDEVVTATGGDGIYLCCSNTSSPVLPGGHGRSAAYSLKMSERGRWVTSEMIARTLSKVEAAMTPQQIAKVRGASKSAAH
jgi:hypothetical protein